MLYEAAQKPTVNSPSPPGLARGPPRLLPRATDIAEKKNSKADLGG